MKKVTQKTAPKTSTVNGKSGTRKKLVHDATLPNTSDILLDVSPLNDSPALEISQEPTLAVETIEEVPSLEISPNGSMVEIAAAPSQITAVDIQTGMVDMFPIEVDDKQGVLQSKRFVKGGMELLSPAELLTPAIRLLAGTGGKITLQGSNEAQVGNLDNTINTAFGRLNLVSRYEIDKEMFYEIGILVAYDLQIPKIKIYRGAKVSACMNLCIWQSEDTVKFDISNGVNMEAVQLYISNLNERIQQSIEIANRLKLIPIAADQMEHIIGKMLLTTINDKLQNGTTSILRAAELFNDSKSKYYYKQPNFNGWQLFNGFTEYFDKKVNFFDIPEKTRDTYKLLKDICFN